MEKICKIVYFDEDSVTDYVQIVAGGELENQGMHRKRKAFKPTEKLELVEFLRRC